jgi:hypothetical protein
MISFGFGFIFGAVAGAFIGYKVGKWDGARAKKPKKGLPTMEAMLADIYKPENRDEQLAADVDFDIEQRIREA